MRNNAHNQDISALDIVILALLGIIFTAFNVIYSSQYGRLAVPPAYDDIMYIKEGYILLDLAYQYGWGHLPYFVLTKVWHAPLEGLQACLAFGILGKELWGPYLLNGGYLIALLILLRREFSAFAISVFLAIVICILAWPLTSFLILEFRPDIPTTLFLAFGGWRLAKHSDEIGQGLFSSPRSIWLITWPFLLALWLKPSYSPVAAGLWLGIWVILAVMNRFLTLQQNALKRTVATSIKCTLVLFLGFLPYLVVSGGHLVDYYKASIFSAGQETWSPPLALMDNLNYYLLGGAGRQTMGWWPIATFAVAMIAIFIASRARDYKALRIGGAYLAMAFVAWLGMTLLSNKSAWFGSVVSTYSMGIFLISAGYIIASLRKVPLMQYSCAALLALLGLSLQARPMSDGVLPNLNLDELASYSREARRVYAETCDAIQNQSGGSDVSLLMPLISTIVNSDSVDLCGVAKGGVKIFVNKIQMSQYSELLRAVSPINKPAKSNELALVMSEDFSGVPGYVPASKHMGSINHLFASSPLFNLVAAVKGPYGIGNIRVYKRRDAFTSLENVTGMKDFEGPYPDKQLPLVRWALFPSAEFDVPVTKGRRARLSFEGLMALHKIGATIRVSTGDTSQCEFATSGISNCKVDFLAQDDHVHVKLDFLDSDKNIAPPAAGQLAVLFSRIEVQDLENPPVGSLQSKSLFTGIDFLGGFGSVEGPYPKHGLPVVIWGRGDASKIGLAGEHMNNGTLLLEWRPGNTVQAIDVLNQGHIIGHCAQGDQSNDFQRCQIGLPGGAAIDNLTLRYVGNSQILSDKMNNSALFKRLQFVEKND